MDRLTAVVVLLLTSIPLQVSGFVLAPEWSSSGANKDLLSGSGSGEESGSASGNGSGSELMNDIEVTPDVEDLNIDDFLGEQSTAEYTDDRSRECHLWEVYDPTIDTCRPLVCPTICPKGYTRIDEECVPPINATVNATLTLNCSCSLIALNESEYEFLDSGYILYNGGVVEVEFNDSLGRPVICTNYTQNGTKYINRVRGFSYPPGFAELNYIGSSLSVIGCLLVLLTYGLFKELRTFPSKILMNLALAIATLNALLVISEFKVTKDNKSTCVASAILIHLFFLCQFSWMSVMTFEIGRTFWRGMKLSQRPSTGSNRKRLVVYLLIGWGLPLAITITTTILNFTTDGLVDYDKLGNSESCWINDSESLLATVLVPLAIALAFNAVNFVFLVVVTCRAWYTQHKLQKSTDAARYLRLLIAVFSVTGLCWGFGFIAMLVDQSWAWYPFIILNSSQGFVIFLAFTFTRTTARLYLSLLRFRGRQDSQGLTRSSRFLSILQSFTCKRQRTTVNS